MDFVSPAEVKEKKSAGMAKSPQSDAVSGIQKKDDGTMPPNKAGHRNFFHCRSNHHWASNCGLLSKTQRQSMYAAKTGKGGEVWEIFKAEVASAKDTSHINVAIEDKVEYGFGFLQIKSNNPHLHDQAEREQLNSDHLYLDSTSPFHQMFDASHIDNVKNVSTILRGSCNASTTLSEMKGWYKGLFHMWLVRNGVENLLSLPQLELEGYCIKYDTITNWVIHIPDGPLRTLRNKLVLKRGVGVCKRFPYLDMDDPSHMRWSCYK